MAPNPALQTLITQQATMQGVPPAIALAVAQQESGFNQNAVGAAGEIGVFQLMPATAAGLGVDPGDVTQNVSGGIGFLAQLYGKYGSWAAALSAYNSGSPTGSPNYANSVLAIAGGPYSSSGQTIDLTDTSSDSVDLAGMDLAGINMGDSSTWIMAGVLGLGLLLVWWES